MFRDTSIRTLVVGFDKYPMRLHEFDQSIQELSYTDPGVRTHLTKLGYRPAGEGGDQTTWLAPDGGILKIFGTHEGQRGMTADHKMFKFWADYCKKHADNPFIPRYSDWATFEYPRGSGQTYLQIKMEKLTEIPEGKLKQALDILEFVVARGETWAQFMTKLTMKLGVKITDHPLFQDMQLFNTVVEINKQGSRRGWGLDLHGDNYMQRGDQIVIVDPWVASS